MLLPKVKVPVVEYGSDYGAWGVVQGSLNEASTVLSFGVGTDASFDLALVDEYGLKVYAFDPTPKSKSWVREVIDTPKFVFHPIGLSEHDNELKLYLPTNDQFVSASCRKGKESSGESIAVEVKALETICRELGITAIDYLKMDIEGSEYGVIRSFCELNEPLLPQQLAVEFHHFQSAFDRSDTLTAIQTLNGLGYEIAWSSATCHELLFVLMGDISESKKVYL